VEGKPGRKTEKKNVAAAGFLKRKEKKKRGNMCLLGPEGKKGPFVQKGAEGKKKKRTRKSGKGSDSAKEDNGNLCRVKKGRGEKKKKMYGSVVAILTRGKS